MNKKLIVFAAWVLFGALFFVWWDFYHGSKTVTESYMLDNSDVLNLEVTPVPDVGRDD